MVSSPEEWLGPRCCCCSFCHPCATGTCPMTPSLPTSSSSHVPCSTLRKGVAPLRLKFGSDPELPSRIPAVIGWHKGSRDGLCSAREGLGLSRVLEVLEVLGEWHMLVAVPPKSG